MSNPMSVAKAYTSAEQKTAFPRLLTTSLSIPCIIDKRLTRSVASSYNYRFPYLYSGISKAYPNLTLIASAYNERDYNLTLPPGVIWDTHHYELPSYFLQNFDFYDNWQEEYVYPSTRIMRDIRHLILIIPNTCPF
jgi:hypothetical protein